MKKRRYIYYIVVALLFLIGMVVYFKNDFSTIKAVNENVEALKQDCTNYLSLSDIERDTLDIRHTNLYTTEKCEYITTSEDKANSFFLVFESIMGSEVFIRIFPLLIPLILLYPVIYSLNEKTKKDYKTKYLKKNNYKQYIAHLFNSSYKYIFIVLLMLFFIILYSAIKSGFNFNPKYDIAMSTIGEEGLLFYNNPITYLVYIIIIILNLLSYINIAIIVQKDNKRNPLVQYIESVLIVFLWWILSFVILGNLADIIFNITSESINLLEIYTWHGITNSGIYLLVNLLFYTITLIITLLIYKKEEKTL